jgi:nucleotide-binding universal stress UspA family protein
VRWRDALFPVHVLPHEHLRAELRRRHLDEVWAEERAAVARRLRDVLGGADTEVELVQALSVEEGLEAARVRRRADGIVVARAAPRDSRRPFPLGSAARALLRRLASQIAVVPPDLTAAGMGDGPIVALSTSAPESLAASRLARAIAAEARRDLSVVPLDRDRGGSPAAALALADARRAPLVVAGARPGAGVLDALEPRTWRWLAAHARQPVVVVPAPAVDAALGRPRRDVEAAGAEGPA